MKKTASLAAALLLMAAQNANAQQSVELYDKVSDSPVKVERLDELQSIHFGGPSLLLLAPGNHIQGEYELKKVRKLVFVPNSEAAIASVTSSKLQIVRKGDVLAVSGWNGMQSANAAIYSVNGQCIAQMKKWNGTDINIAALRPGVYVFKVGSASFKFNK